MFKITETLDDFALTTVLYHVYLRVYERDRFFSHDGRRRRMQTIMRADELPMIPTIEAIIAEMEQDAGAPLQSIPEARLRDYTRRLEEIADARKPPMSEADIERAERTLEEIRREFGYAA